MRAHRAYLTGVAGDVKEKLHPNLLWDSSFDSSHALGWYASHVVVQGIALVKDFDRGDVHPRESGDHCSSCAQRHGYDTGIRRCFVPTTLWLSRLAVAGVSEKASTISKQGVLIDKPAPYSLLSSQQCTAAKKTVPQNKLHGKSPDGMTKGPGEPANHRENVTGAMKWIAVLVNHS